MVIYVFVCVFLSSLCAEKVRSLLFMTSGNVIVCCMCVRVSYQLCVGVCSTPKCMLR